MGEVEGRMGDQMMIFFTFQYSCYSNDDAERVPEGDHGIISSLLYMKIINIHTQHTHRDGL